MKNFVVAFIVVCLFTATAAAQQQQPAAQQPAPQQTVQQAAQQPADAQQPAAIGPIRTGKLWWEMDIPGLDSYINALPMYWQTIIRFGAGLLLSFLFLCGGKISSMIADNVIPFSGLIVWLIVGFMLAGLTFNPCPVASVLGLLCGVSAYRYILTLMPVDEIAG